MTKVYSRSGQLRRCLCYASSRKRRRVCPLSVVTVSYTVYYVRPCLKSMSQTLQVHIIYNTYKTSVGPGFQQKIMPSFEQLEVCWQFIHLNRKQERNGRLDLSSHCLPVGQSQSHIETDGQSVCLSWCRAPCGAHDQIFILP
jgi:hypothetical protein